jgi:hypothetical protein
VLARDVVAETCDIALEDQAEEVDFNNELKGGKNLGELSGASAKIAAALERQKV